MSLTANNMWNTQQLLLKQMELTLKQYIYGILFILHQYGNKKTHTASLKEWRELSVPDDEM